MKFPTEKHLQDFATDKFNYKDLSKKILDEILLNMELPNCFGLYGNWGSGKSTILHFTMKHMAENKKDYGQIVPVYFEPWKYEYSDQKDLLLALLNSIKQKLGIKSKAMQKLLIDALVIGSGLLRHSMILNPSEIISDFKNFENMIYDDHERWIDRVEKFRNNFEAIIKKGLNGKKTKIIIFIDDLDRCLPDNAVKLLEGIKNFLTVENTLFVLAIDRTVISEMIEKKYGLHYGYGDEYLMKIINYHYELPKNDKKEIVEEILNLYKVSHTQRQKDYINNFLIAFAAETRKTKYLLRQLCMNIVLSSKAKELLDGDDKEIQLQYLLVATFLLLKFSKLFSGEDTKVRLNNIRESTAFQLRPDRNLSYEDICAKDKSINNENRGLLENIMRHQIIMINQQPADRGLLDVEKLNVAIQAIKNV